MTDYVAGTMINQTTLFTSSSLYSGNINAGNIAAGNVSVTGTLPPPVGIYANAANSLALATNSAARLIVDPNGNVGIATGTPVQPLHVQGNSYLTGSVGIGISNPSYKFVVSNTGAEGVEIGPGYLSGRNLFQSYNRSGASYVQLDSVASVFTWQIAGAESMRITSAGNVGIATTAVAAGNQLSVYGGNIQVGTTGNGVKFADGTYQSTAAVAGGVGIGQTWQNVTASRAVGTNYTNSTGNPIMVAMTGVPGFSVLVNGSTIGYMSFGGSQMTQMSTFIVPNGATYQMSNSPTTLNYWWELR